MSTFKIVGYLVDLNKHLVDGTLLTSFAFDNPVPVYSGGELVGAANLRQTDSFIIAKAFIRRDHPDRLSLEVGQNVYLRLGHADFVDPYLANGHPRFTQVAIHSLEVSPTPVDPDLGPAEMEDLSAE